MQSIELKFITMLNTQHFHCLVGHQTQICQIPTKKFSIHKVIYLKEGHLTIIYHLSKVYIFNLSKKRHKSLETLEPNLTMELNKRYPRYFRTKQRIKLSPTKCIRSSSTTKLNFKTLHQKAASITFSIKA